MIQAKFISYNKLLSSIEDKIQKQQEELEWYKFKVEQVAKKIAHSV